MRRTLTKLSCLFALSCGLFAASAMAQNPHGKTHGAWGVRCNTPVGAPSACEMFQIVLLKGVRQPILTFAVGFTDTAPTPIGNIVIPFSKQLPSVYLSSGVTLQVDSGQVYELQVEFCAQKGCSVKFSIDDTLLNLFKGGKTIAVGFYTGAPDRKPVRVPVSLTGFTAAIKDIQ